jgi:hypothetical protein
MDEKNDYVVTTDSLKALPEPVQRYMNFSDVLGKPWIHSVRLNQSGRFRTAADRPWMAMRAVQTYATEPPSFSWEARFKLFGLPLLRAKDQYASGHGHMFGRLAGIYTLFDERGEELDQGAMIRYLSEMIWFPIAFLGENIKWEAIDDGCAQVTLTDGDKSVSGKLFIDSEGRPINFSAMRYREDKGDYSLDAWSTPITDYGERIGLMLPVRGQAMWHLESGPLTYIDLLLGEIEYNVNLE